MSWFFEIKDAGNFGAGVRYILQGFEIPEVRVPGISARQKIG